MTTIGGRKSSEKLATPEEIREVIGPFEKEVILRILDIEPTLDDVQAAYAWLRSDEFLMRNLSHNLGSKAAAVFEILHDEFPDFDSGAFSR
ncbi:hypothetical protein [Cupriavidus necator]|uniref:hypothetical protein n=1 Tax=Cupriavidus necator TaxID=106590 RepID=UPI0039C42969